MKRQLSPSSRQGFTLTELLTVIAIISILAGILIPVVGSVRDSARATKCQSNLRQVYIALMLYVNDHKRWLPPGQVTPAIPGTSSIGLTAIQPANAVAGVTNAMVTHLSPYMGIEPTASPGTFNPIFFCPGQTPPTKRTDFVDLSKRTRTYRIRAEYQPRLDYPFGYLADHPPQKLDAYLNMRSPAISYILQDVDSAISQDATVVEKQSHKKGRNYLFFDGSVRILNPVQEATLTEQLNR